MRDHKSHSWCWQSSCRNHRPFCMVLLCSQTSLFCFSSSIPTTSLISFCKFKTVLLLACSSGLRSNRLKKQRLLNPQCQDMEQDHLFSGSHTSTDCSKHGLGGLIPTQDSAGLQRICSYEVFSSMSSFVFDNQNQSPTKVSPPNFSL